MYVFKVAFLEICVSVGKSTGGVFRLSRSESLAYNSVWL